MYGRFVRTPGGRAAVISCKSRWERKNILEKNRYLSPAFAFHHTPNGCFSFCLYSPFVPPAINRSKHRLLRGGNASASLTGNIIIFFSSLFDPATPSQPSKISRIGANYMFNCSLESCATGFGRIEASSLYEFINTL